MRCHHDRGYTQPVSEHLKHMMFAWDKAIACMTWSSAPRYLGSRDRFIGPRAQVRLANIRQVAYNIRCPIMPRMTVPRLA
jgi:hypothetical protein